MPGPVPGVIGIRLGGLGPEAHQPSRAPLARILVLHALGFVLAQPRPTDRGHSHSAATGATPIDGRGERCQR